MVGVISHPHFYTSAAHWVVGIVDDSRREDLCVSNQHYPPVMGAQTRGAKLDPLDTSFKLADYDLITDLERPQRQEQNARHEIRKNLFQGEAKHNSGEPEARSGRCWRRT